LRIFVCEYVTGGGLCGQPLPASLSREGDMMLTALVKDLAALDGVEIVTTRDKRLPALRAPADVAMVSEPGELWPRWAELIRSADAVWPIAPESGGVLARVSELTVDARRNLLACDPQSVRLTSSKLATAQYLTKAGIPTVPTAPLGNGEAFGRASAWVVKPDDGAGAENTLLFDAAADLDRWMAANQGSHMILQPYVSGPAASLSLLCRDGAAWLLTCNEQLIEITGNQFRYRGFVVAGREARRAEYQPIASAVAAAIPGLWGYVGVDLIDGPDGPVVLEINPRLTTSYAGLRRAVGVNPAGLVLDLLNRKIPDIQRPLQVTPQRVDVELSDA
jgi:predicted ATP-grasp superfamily ATP-dependent carboligase